MHGGKANNIGAIPIRKTEAIHGRGKKEHDSIESSFADSKDDLSESFGARERGTRNTYGCLKHGK